MLPSVTKQIRKPNNMTNTLPEELQAEDLEAKKQLAQRLHPNFETIPMDSSSLLHELHVHKIELEMQNDELQKANLALAESHQRYKALYEFAPIALLSLNDQGLITECNSNALSMFGINHKKLNQYRFAQFVDDHDKSNWHSIFINMKCLIEDVQSSFNIRLINNAGEILYAIINCLRMHNNSETEILRLSVIDVTDDMLSAQKQAEDKVEHELLLKTSMDGFWISNMDGQILDVNDTYCQMSGYSQSELLTMKISDIEANESAIDIAAHLQYMVSKGQDRFETKHRRKDGSVFEVRINAQYIGRDGGRFVVFLQDLSSMKVISDQLARLQNEHHSLEVTKQQLQTALDSDRNVSVAVGIVMGQQQVGKDAAMKLLRKRARDQNLKLNELATILVNARESLNFEIKV